MQFLQDRWKVQHHSLQALKNIRWLQNNRLQIFSNYRSMASLCGSSWICFSPSITHFQEARLDAKSHFPNSHFAVPAQSLRINVLLRHVMPQIIRFIFHLRGNSTRFSKLAFKQTPAACDLRIFRFLKLFQFYVYSSFMGVNPE